LSWYQRVGSCAALVEERAGDLCQLPIGDDSGSAIKKSSCAPRILRHPGAGCLMRSRTIGDNRAPLGDFVKMLFDLIGWDAESTRQFGV
jgi:hypothetical protein